MFRAAQKLSGVCKVCGKRRFATREAAEAVIRRRQAAGYAEKRAYQAHGWWHLTKKK